MLCPGRRLSPSGCEGSVPASYFILLLLLLVPSTFIKMFVRIAAVIAMMVVSFVVPVTGWSYGAGLNLDVEGLIISYSVSQIGGGAWLNDGALSIFLQGLKYSSRSNASGLVPLTCRPWAAAA